MKMTMKKFQNILLYTGVVVALAFSAGAFIKANAASTSSQSAPVAGQPVDLTYAAEKALPAVVHIKYLQNSKVQEVEVDSNPFGDFFDPFGFFGNPGQGGKQRRQVQTPKREASGSGVIISADGYIVTNNHVVNGADELTVTLNDNREFSARIIGTDETTDLALIKVDGKNLPTLPIGDSDKLKVGEWVLAVGNPFNLNSTVTAGIVSAKARSLGANGVESFIQTDVRTLTTISTPRRLRARRLTSAPTRVSISLRLMRTAPALPQVSRRVTSSPISTARRLPRWLSCRSISLTNARATRFRSLICTRRARRLLRSL